VLRIRVNSLEEREKQRDEQFRQKLEEISTVKESIVAQNVIRSSYLYPQNIPSYPSRDNFNDQWCPFSPVHTFRLAFKREERWWYIAFDRDYYAKAVTNIGEAATFQFYREKYLRIRGTSWYLSARNDGRVYAANWGDAMGIALYGSYKAAVLFASWNTDLFGALCELNNSFFVSRNRPLQLTIE